MSIIKNLYYSLIFLSDHNYNKKMYISEKIYTFWKLLLAFGPVAYLLNICHAWFVNNAEFVSGFVVVVAINAVFGIWKHKKLGTFSYEKFYKETSVMLACVIAIYILLSIMATFTGDSLVSEVFTILIQVSTLFYPTSKAVKSIHILSEGEYPSEFIMKKFYNFEKEGNVTDFFNTKKEKENENI